MDSSTSANVIGNKIIHGEQDFPEILQAVKNHEYKQAAQLLEKALEEEGIDEIEMMGIFDAVTEIDQLAIGSIRQHIQDEYLQGVIDGYITKS